MKHSFELFVTKNEVQEPRDGGRLVLRATNPPEGVRQLEIIVNAETDEFLSQFGTTRQEIENTVVVVSLEVSS